MQENIKPDSPIIRFEKIYKITDPLCQDDETIKTEDPIKKPTISPQISIIDRDSQMISIDIYDSKTPLTPLISTKVKSCWNLFSFPSTWKFKH